MVYLSISLFGRREARRLAYLSDPFGSYYSAPLDWLRDAGAEIAYIHTSGNASQSDLREFAEAVRPKVVGEEGEYEGGSS